MIASQARLKSKLTEKAATLPIRLSRNIEFKVGNN